MSESKQNYIAGDLVLATDLNHISQNSNDGGGFRDGINAQAVISAFKPVFYDSVSGGWIQSNGNDTSRYFFDGISLEAGTIGSPMAVQTNGIVRGFGGLVAGSRYYVNNSGDISTAKGTYDILVGVAISSTELLITKSTKGEFRGTDTFSNSIPSSTAGDLTDTMTMPSIANECVINYEVVLSSTNKANGQLVVKRKGVITAHDKGQTAGSDFSYEIEATLSGNTITLLCRESVTGSAASRSFSGTGYFYT